MTQIAHPIVWLHGDSLTPTDPALQANPTAPAVFVFDEPFLVEAQLSFKRLFFLYECALEALAQRPGEVRRGDVVAEVLDFYAAYGGDTLHVTNSVAPRFQRYLAALRQHIAVIVYPAPTLVTWTGRPPRRFSTFWRKIEAEARQATGIGPPELW